MGGSASTRRIAPRANQPPCLLEPVTAEVCNSQAPTPSATALLPDPPRALGLERPLLWPCPLSRAPASRGSAHDASRIG